MKRLWELDKGRLRTKQIKNKMFLRTYIEGRNAWYIAANRSKLDAVQ